LSVGAFALGSPLVFLISCTYVYHEAILWGLGGGLWGLSFFQDILLGQSKSRWTYWGLSASAAVGFLSRINTSAFLYGLISLLVLDICTKKRKEMWYLIGLTLPAGAALIYQLCYNHHVFGSPWTFVDFRYYKDWATAGPAIGGTFNLQRISVALQNYFGFAIHSDLSNCA